MDVAGKTVLVTGSTDGVGKLVARRLAEAGATVLLHGRSDEKGMRVLNEIRTATGSRALEYYRADFSSLDEVRSMAEVVAARHDRLDILINNAGIGATTQGARHREESRDGYELRFAVNYLAAFLLTTQLLPTIQRSAPARVVNVSSLGQYPIDFADVMLTRGYDGTRAYSQSKLAQIIFTFDLAERLKDTGVTVNALHPATFMNTNMVTQSGIRPLSRVEDGADAVLYVATSSELEGKSGIFFDGRRPAQPESQAYDAAARRQLWNLSTRLVRDALENRMAA